MRGFHGLSSHVHAYETLFGVHFALKLEHFLTVVGVNRQLDFILISFVEGQRDTETILDVNVIAISEPQKSSCNVLLVLGPT